MNKNVCFEKRLLEDKLKKSEEGLEINMPIGFFDSGIGGLTVLREAINLMPNEDYLYYADTLNAPYGTKSKEKVKGFIFEAAHFLVKKGIKALVVACNTATIIAINDLREKYNIPIIGIEPAVKPAVELNENTDKRVLILATPLALKEDKFKSLVCKVDKTNKVDILPTPELVEFAEKFIFDENILIPYFTNKFSGHYIEGYGTVVLGCTHFPLFKDTLKKVLPKNIDIIDGSLGTVNRLMHVMEELQIASKSKSKGNIMFYTSGKKVTDIVVIDKYMNLLNDVEANVTP